MGGVRDVTVGQLLEEWSRRCPDKLALVAGERSLNFGQLQARVEFVAGALHRLGIERGDRVAVWLNNRQEWIELQFALARLGAILVTVNTALRSQELDYLLRQCRARALIYMQGTHGLNFVEEVAGLNYRPDFKIFVDQPVPPEAIDYHSLPSGPVAWPDIGLDECLNMQYTSGTTGFPKGVRLTSRNIVNNGYWLGRGLSYTPEDRLCLCVPLFHCFGCVIGVLGAYTHGASLHLVPSFEPLAVMETVERDRCTALYGVPTMFLAQLEHPEFERFDFSSLRTGVMAGSLCPEALMGRVIERMNLKEMTIAYGLTEASPAITQTLPDDPLELRTQTVGRVLPELEVEIRDPASGRALGANELGELCVRGYNVMEGYHDDPEATARAVDEQGWLATGDQAAICPRGYVRITGRIKDIIIRGGENVSPREVEDHLRSHPSVLDAAVYALPHEKYGEEVAAAIRLRPGRQAGEQELKEHCKEHLSYFKIPTSWRFVEEFPLTASGKIQKFRLRASHHAGAQG
ncbi:MAG: AMP-binding protein [Candidatus Eremiobacteraeota bacterium]|nr:AMP-binding protein [Candidatus Eremiobacteraeota bacterium]MCW5867036.1 AMP-binding protein [Candidatus Eremiobacteraeota bacterium]